MRETLLVFGGGSDGLLADLEAEGFALVRTATMEKAGSALRDAPIALAIVCPEAPDDSVEQLVSLIERTRRGTPLLAIRKQKSVDPESWARLGIGVLRYPLVPGALSRSVDVVLGLKRTS